MPTALTPTHEVFRLKDGAVLFSGTKRECFSWVKAANRSASSMHKIIVSWRQVPSVYHVTYRGEFA